MRGPGYLITLIGRAKKGLHILICPVFTENVGIVKSKKRYTRPQMFCFPLKASAKKKNKVFIVCDEAPIFSEALGFSLLSLCVNSALCLQSIFNLSTCDMFNLCGLQTRRFRF